VGRCLAPPRIHRLSVLPRQSTPQRGSCPLTSQMTCWDGSTAQPLRGPHMDLLKELNADTSAARLAREVDELCMDLSKATPNGGPVLPHNQDLVILAEPTCCSTVVRIC